MNLMENQNQLDHNVHVGVISAVSGVKGYVKILCFTEKPEDIVSFKEVFDGYGRYYDLKIISIKKSSAIASIEGISSRNDAEPLVNSILMIKRSELPAAEKDEFYCADLLGNNVLCAKTKEVLGVVQDIFGVGGVADVLEVYNEETGRTLRYPFAKHFIKDIDLEKKCILINPIAEEEEEK